MPDKNTFNLISVVIPIFNELENLPKLLPRLRSTLHPMPQDYELVLIDDGSHDGSAEYLAQEAKKPNSHIVLVELSANFGQHAAVMAGFATTSGDIIVTMDADLQNPPEEIPRLIETAAQGYEVVGTVRAQRQDTWFRRFASTQVNRLTQYSTGVKMSDFGCMLRAYQRNVVESMLKCPESSTFIPLLATNFTKKYIEIPVEHQDREEGKSKYNLYRLISLQFDLLTSTTTTPLRLVSILGLGVALFGILFGMTLLGLRLSLGDEWGVNGIFPLFALLFILTGAQFLGLGLLGEYIGRIYCDVRGRPTYVIDRVIKSSDRDAIKRKPEIKPNKIE